MSKAKKHNTNERSNTMDNTSTDLLKRCKFLKVSVHRWGITRKVALPPPPDADPARFKHSKALIVSKEYDAIVSFQNETNALVKRYSMPSFVFPGVIAVANGGVEVLDAMLKRQASELPAKVKALVDAMPGLIDAAKTDLNGNFTATDYPPVADIAGRFAIRWQWISFDVPEGLPPELREAEAKKLRERFEEAQSEIVAALREGFAKLVSDAVERLKVAPGEKPRIFRDSLIENFKEFFDTFSMRNLMDDKDLDAIVEQAKALLSGVKPDVLRNNSTMRQEVAENLGKVQEVITKLIQEQPVRRFDFDA
jgi:hypothetical protein